MKMFTKYFKFLSLLYFRNMSPSVTSHSRNWFMEHKFIILMVGYVVVLIAVGIGDVKYIKTLYKKLMNWSS